MGACMAVQNSDNKNKPKKESRKEEVSFTII